MEIDLLLLLLVSHRCAVAVCIGLFSWKRNILWLADEFWKYTQLHWKVAGHAMLLGPSRG